MYVDLDEDSENLSILYPFDATKCQPESEPNLSASET
jgi:hypothetical protein